MIYSLIKIHDFQIYPKIKKICSPLLPRPTTWSYLSRADCYISDCRRSLAMVATPPPSWEELGPAACLSTVLRGTLGSKLIWWWSNICWPGRVSLCCLIIWLQEGTDTYSLVSCICVPPFSWDLFTSATETQIIQLFPHLAENISTSKK